VQLGSKHADFYFSSHFSGLLLPNDIDSGHIPTFGLYIALVWQDWALARSEPFGDTAICYWDCLANFTFVHKFVPARYAGIAGLLILIDPSLLPDYFGFA
jgi:hypothetical protein